MNRHSIIATLLFSMVSLAVAADNGPIKVCELLQSGSLAPWGYAVNPGFKSQSKDYAKAEAYAPSDVHSDVCTLLGETNTERHATTVMVESLSNETSAEEVANWIKAVSSMDKWQDLTTEEVKIGDATCESGKYDLPADGMPASQYFVACDRLVGARHLTINMQQPEEAKLPTPAEIKNLLDQAAERLALLATQAPLK